MVRAADIEVGEGDVARDRLTDDSDVFEPHVAVPPQLLDQADLALVREGRGYDRGDRGIVMCGAGSDQDFRLRFRHGSVHLNGMTKTINVGIIGAARVVVYAMVGAAKENARVNVLAVAARDPVRAKAFADEHSISRVHEAYDSLIADPEVDLVYVATPPALHAVSALKALAAGKHVLVEKPFTANAREAASVVAAAAKAKRRVFEAFHYRHHRLWHRIVEIARGGVLGEIRSLEAGFHVPIAQSEGEFRWNPTLGGGALMDLGCYPLQWVRVFAGEEPVVTSARMRIVKGVDAETEAELRFPSGATARVSCSMTGEDFRAFLNVEGTSGRIEVVNPLAPQFGHSLQTEIGGAVRTEMLDGPSTFAAQLEAVAATLLDGAPFPLAADDPVKSMAAIDAVRAAAVRG